MTVKVKPKDTGQTPEQTPGKTNPNDVTPTPDSGTPTGANSEQQGQTPQDEQRPPATPPPLHEHPDFKSRMEQAQRSGMRALLTELGITEGIDTPEGLTAAQQKISAELEYAKQQREANMTAEERLNEKISTLTSERDQLKQERDRLQREADEAKQALVEFKVDLARAAAVETAATAAGASHAADVVMWLRANRPAELAQIMGEDGTVDDEQVKTLVDACRDARPEWFAPRTPGSPSHGGARAPLAPDRDDERRKLARETARRGMR